MLLKYRTPAGQEVTVESEQELIMALRTRRIAPDTPVQLPGYRSWMQASTLSEYGVWVDKAISYIPAAPAPPAPPALSERQATWLWLGVGMIGGGSIILTGSLLFLLETDRADWILLVGSLIATLIRDAAIALALVLIAILILRGKGRRFWLVVPIMGLLLFGESLFSAGYLAVNPEAPESMRQVQQIIQAALQQSGLAPLQPDR